MVMADRYDNIVIGAGISGLVCGGFLAKYGQKTLILEKADKIGGRLNPSSWEGYTTVMHVPWIITSLGGGFWPNAARELGANFRFNIAKEANFYFTSGDRSPFRIQRCYAPSAMVDYMIEYLDAHRPDLITDGLQEELLPIVEEFMAIPFKQMCEDWLEISLKDWIEARTSNPSIKYVLASVCASVGSMGDIDFTLETASAGKMFASIRGGMTGEGVWSIAIPDPARGIAQPIADSITEKFGCEIRTGVPVSEVLIEDGKAIGVLIRREGEVDEVIYADHIIVAIVWPQLPSLFATLPPSLETCLARPLQHNMIGMFQTWYMDKVITSDGSFSLLVDPETGSNVGGIYAQSVEQPWNSPEGKQLFWGYSIHMQDAWDALGPERALAQLNAIAEARYPGFKEATIHARGGAGPAYSFFGHTCYPHIEQKSPDVESLYFAGDGTAPMYGTIMEGASTTGASVAKKILGLKILAGV